MLTFKYVDIEKTYKEMVQDPDTKDTQILYDKQTGYVAHKTNVTPHSH